MKQRVLPSTHRTGRTALIASVVTAAMLTLAACSSGSDDTTDGGTTGSTDGGDVLGGDDGGTDGGTDCGSVDAAVSYTEARTGELSDDIAAPTLVNLGPGANTISASTGSGDLEYLTVTVGACDTLDSIFLTAYDSPDQNAFMALQAGSVFTVAPLDAQAQIAELAGYSHFGPAVMNTDLLQLASTAPQAAGFTTPLAAGDYAIWIQQLGTTADYTMTFNISRVSN